MDDNDERPTDGDDGLSLEALPITDGVDRPLTRQELLALIGGIRAAEAEEARLLAEKEALEAAVAAIAADDLDPDAPGPFFIPVEDDADAAADDG